MALMARSKLPAAASSNHCEIWTTRRLHSMLRCSLSMAWMATAQSLNVLAVAHHEVEALEALAVARPPA